MHDNDLNHKSLQRQPPPTFGEWLLIIFVVGMYGWMIWEWSVPL